MPRAALLALLLAVCGSGGAAAERYEISPPAPGAVSASRPMMPAGST